MIERETKFSNQILYNLLQDYSTVDIKILSCIVNRLVTMYKALENEEAEINIDVLEIGISVDFFNQYKGKKNLTRTDINLILNKICSFGIQTYEEKIYTRINIVKKVSYDELHKSFKIYFNDEAMDYLILIYDNFTLLDLEIIKDFSGKYELGIYILIQMFKNTGKIIKKVEDIKKYFGTDCENKIVLNNMRNALLKLNSKFNFNAIMEYEKINKRIDKVIIKFRRNQNEK